LGLMVMAIRRLQNKHKIVLVGRLACFDTPSEAATALSEEFGLTITPQAVERHDPGKRAGATLPEPWRELFAKTRQAFLEDCEQVPIANKSVRLRELNKAYHALRNRGDWVAATAVLE